MLIHEEAILIIIRISKDKPVNTITAAEGGSLIHYEQPCKLSGEALIKCSSFPIDYNFADESIKYIVGMSVPPLMMKRGGTRSNKTMF